LERSVLPPKPARFHTGARNAAPMLSWLWAYAPTQPPSHQHACSQAVADGSCTKSSPGGTSAGGTAAHYTRAPPEGSWSEAGAPAQRHHKSRSAAIHNLGSWSLAVAPAQRHPQSRNAAMHFFVPLAISVPLSTRKIARPGSAPEPCCTSNASKTMISNLRPGPSSAQQLDPPSMP
jgi:hypothetical protein